MSAQIYILPVVSRRVPPAPTESTTILLELGPALQKKIEWAARIAATSSAGVIEMLIIHALADLEQKSVTQLIAELNQG